MKTVLSTLMFEVKDLGLAIEYAEKLGVLLEIFPMWHDEIFVRFMEENKEKLKEITYSFHEPYFFSDHSFPADSPEYQTTMEMCRRTFEWARELGAKHMVFHHNNRKVTPENKRELIENGFVGLAQMNEWAKEYGVPVLFENTGVLARQNMLFDEDEFIQIIQVIENQCLFDVGHAYANGWNIERVITTLQDKIEVYHLNDNDGTDDQHQIFGKGEIDLNAFKKIARELTPNAVMLLEHTEDLGITMDDIQKEIKFLSAPVLANV